MFFGARQGCATHGKTGHSEQQPGCARHAEAQRLGVAHVDNISNAVLGFGQGLMRCHAIGCGAVNSDLLFCAEILHTIHKYGNHMHAVATVSTYGYPRKEHGISCTPSMSGNTESEHAKMGDTTAMQHDHECCMLAFILLVHQGLSHGCIHGMERVHMSRMHHIGRCVP